MPTMSKVTFNDVRQKCANVRFFPYDTWHDRIFVPPAILLTWLFVRLGVGGNAVSWLSGIIVVAGAFALSSNNGHIVAVGSLGYLFFYLLDYVDGGVARYNGTAGMSGQYIDWIIHIIASVATMAGLLCGASHFTGDWIFLFGILAIVAAALTTGRYSMGWFAVCMERQQRIVKGADLSVSNEIFKATKPPSSVFRVIKAITTVLFHENYIIFVLPILAFLQLILPEMIVDFRIIMIIIGGLVYFPVMILDIHKIAKENSIDKAYHKLFIDEKKPNLPNDHFFIF